jgi:hypothetical protein
MAGCPKCAIDLVRANPHKPIVQYPNGYITFRELRVGETLWLPDVWFNGLHDQRPASYFAALPSADGQHHVPPSAGGILGAPQSHEPPKKVQPGPQTAGASYGGNLPSGGAQPVGGSGDTITFQPGHRYRITIYTSIARSALTQAQKVALAGWLDGLGLDSGSITNVTSEQPDANTGAVTFDYTGPLHAEKLPDSPLPDIAQMTVEDLGASPPPAAQGMSTGVKVVLGAAGLAALVALVYFSTEGR